MDNENGCRRFILVDDEYKFLLDHVNGENRFLPLYEDDNGVSETREFDVCSVDSRRTSLGGVTEKKPTNRRVSQRRTNGSEAEVSRAFTSATIRESIQRDNRVAERRKRKMAELEAARVSKDVPCVRNQRDKKARRVTESKVDTLRDVPLVRAQETTQRVNIARKVSESTKVDTSGDVPLVRAKEVIQRDREARKVSESKVNTSRAVPFVRNQGIYKARKVSESKVSTSHDVPLVRAKEVIQRDYKARKVSESSVNTSQDVPLFRTKEAIRQDNMFAERRKKNIDETKAAGTSRVVTEPKTVDETSRFVPMTQSNKGVSVGVTRKKKKNVAVVDKDYMSYLKKKNVSVVDKDYMSYLAWLVHSSRDSTTVPDPIPETQKQSRTVPEKDVSAKVTVNLDTESCSGDDDDDIFLVSDSPFLSGDSTPFVVSKNKTVIDLEKDSTEDESRNCLFTKELMVVLEKPYDKEELLTLSNEVSMKGRVSRCRELRKGRVSNYKSSEPGHSYLEKVSDFDKEYRSVDGDDKARLNLLRGFFFYLKNVTRPGSFKPWLPENQKKLGLRKQCLQPNHKECSRSCG